MIKVQAAGFSDIGKVRKANEDCFLLNEPIGLYVVADGMGGHRGGGVASRIAVETINGFMASPSQEFSDADGTHTVEAQSSAANRLCQSIFLANQKIYAQSVSDKTCRGMGTTVSALYLAGNSIITANVGDSPIYLLRNREIETLYTPHTLLHERKKIPKSMEGRFSESKLAHILTRAVGIRSEVGVDLVETPCFSEDIVVLCSDGLSGKISREEIRDLVYQNDSQSACRKLTDLANQRGGEDNISVIVVRVTSSNERPANRLFGRIVGIPAWIASLFRAKKRS
ncbi:MAG: serine/threonine-protein phosphatase [Desulfosarcina sp.]|nr:serine/threonine-protein phosphatase [Desulfosarcina sp.]